MDIKNIDNRKIVKTVTILSTATLPKESRCGTDETLRERIEIELILLKIFLMYPTMLRVGFFVLLGRLLRLFEILAGDILGGLMAMCFVRYIQLETSTSITAKGRR